eukprot:4961128-Lingulodinium_polyedra.AAC.1
MAPMSIPITYARRLCVYGVRMTCLRLVEHVAFRNIVSTERAPRRRARAGRVVFRIVSGNSCARKQCPCNVSHGPRPRKVYLLRNSESAN